MQLIVWKVGEWQEGRYPSKENGVTYDVQRVVFKSMDSKNARTFYLNLDKRHPENVAKWQPYMREGNVLDVVIMPKGGMVNNDTTINKFDPFKVIRDISKEEKTDARK